MSSMHSCWDDKRDQQHDGLPHLSVCYCSATGVVKRQSVSFMCSPGHMLIETNKLMFAFVLCYSALKQCVAAMCDT